MDKLNKFKYINIILIYIDKIMAVYLKKRDRRHRDLVDSYYTMVNEAEKFRDKENAAALGIQKYWRMFRVKWKF
jgi:hypothetical protein